jgi:hypothetical protein
MIAVPHTDEGDPRRLRKLNSAVGGELSEVVAESIAPVDTRAARAQQLDRRFARRDDSPFLEFAHNSGETPNTLARSLSGICPDENPRHRLRFAAGRTGALKHGARETGQSR